jgi:hypothetical protein
MIHYTYIDDRKPYSHHEGTAEKITVCYTPDAIRVVLVLNHANDVKETLVMGRGPGQCKSFACDRFSLRA